MKTIAVKLCSMEPGRKSHILKGIFMVEAIFLLVLIVITSTPAFYYKTDARNAKTACLMEDNMSMSQMLPANRGGVLSGLSIQFGTFQRVNVGIVKIDLYENDSLVRSTAYKTEDLVDNVFQDFYFSSPITLKPEYKYSFTISCNYENGENSIAVWTALADEPDCADGHDPVSYKQILVNRALQKRMILFGVPIFLLIIIIVSFLVNLNVSASKNDVVQSSRFSAILTTSLFEALRIFMF